MSTHISYIKKNINNAIIGLFDVYSLLKAAWFPLLMALFYVFAFSFTSQAIDFFTAMLEDGKYMRALAYCGWTLVFSLLLWFCCIMIFTLKEIRFYEHVKIRSWQRDEKNKHQYEKYKATADDIFQKYSKNVSITIGLLAWLAPLGGLCNAAGPHNWPVYAVSLLGFFLYIFSVFFFSDRIAPIAHKTTEGGGKSGLSASAHKLSDLSEEYKWLLTILVILAIAWLVMGAMSPFFMAQISSSANVIASALCVYLALGTVIYYFSFSLVKGIVIPFLPIMVIVLLLFSKCNDNHKITYGYLQHTPNGTIKSNGLNDSAKIKNRQPADKAFREWLQVQAENFPAPQRIPVIFLAHEGGGIRAMQWSGLLLYLLQQKLDKKFYPSVFATSGASGGGVGSLFYQAYYKDCKENKIRDSLDIWRAFLQKDYLTQLTAGFLFRDFLARFSPFPVNAADRAKLLEESFRSEYENVFEKNSLEYSFLSLWEDSLGNPVKYQMPNIIVSSSIVETGQMGLTSNLKLPDEYAQHTQDISSITGRDVQITTAALHYCRFPFITPAGLIFNSTDDTAKFHIADAGYHDNYGLGNIIRVLKMSTKIVKTEFPHLADRVQFVVVLFKNSKESEGPQINDLAHEITNVFSGGFNNLFGDDNFNRWLGYYQDQNIQYMEFQLPRDAVPMPLSWTISRQTSDWIYQRAQAATGVDTMTMDEQNYETFNRLRNLFR